MNSQTQATRQRVRLLRMGAAYTQEELAERASLSVETVQRLERTGRASSKTLTAVARALAVDPSEVRATGRTMVVACMSEKGGVGRTTLTFNLAVLLASLGNSVCAIQVGERGMLVEECHAVRRRPLPKFSSCWMPDPQVIDDWLGTSRSYSHIIIDGTRYRPDVNEVLVRKADIILIPITNIAMDEPALDILMAQIAAKRDLSTAPVMLLFNQPWGNNAEFDQDVRKVQTRYGRIFPSVRMTQRKAFATSEDGTLFGPLSSPVLTPRAREARKACQELANLWNSAERTFRRNEPRLPSAHASPSDDPIAICSSLPTIRSRRPAPTKLERCLMQLRVAEEFRSTP